MDYQTIVKPLNFLAFVFLRSEYVLVVDRNRAHYAPLISLSSLCVTEFRPAILTQFHLSAARTVVAMPGKPKKSKSLPSDDFDAIIAQAEQFNVSNITTTSSSSSSSTDDSSGSSSSSSQVEPTDVEADDIMTQMCIDGDLVRLRRYLNRGRVVVGARHLCLAASRGRLEIVCFLVKEHGADVNKTDDDGISPLYVAAESGHLELMRYLVKVLGARVDQTDNKGSTLLHIAAENGNLDVVKCLGKELGVEVNQARQDGGTPLHIAAQHGHLKVVKCLVKELGANVNQTGVDGGDALFIAAAMGKMAVTKCLVKDLGADVNRPRLDGGTPVNLAAQTGNKEMVVFLVEHLGADVNLASKRGSTPLMIASVMKHEKIVRYLLKNGADAQKLHPRGGTASEISRTHNGSSEQTAYLEARTLCANPGCDGAGLKKCAGCLEVFFCSNDCQVAAWPAHKAECRRCVQAKAGKKM
jgi:ankyrin repeat protein